MKFYLKIIIIIDLFGFFTYLLILSENNNYSCDISILYYVWVVMFCYM